jgi:hypothetical protein
MSGRLQLYAEAMRSCEVFLETHGPSPMVDSAIRQIARLIEMEKQGAYDLDYLRKVNIGLIGVREVVDVDRAIGDKLFAVAGVVRRIVESA